MFETIYRWFINLYGSNLAEHLSGWDEVKGDYSNMNLFSLIGIISLIIALLSCIIYYYAYNHPRQNRWWKWLLLWLLPQSMLSFLTAFAITYSDVLSDSISSDLLPISWYNCLGFAFTNFIVSASFFIIISFMIKWGSRNCKHSPCF